MYVIRKEFSFSASHCLDYLPPEHPCSRVHGHNYIITVELKCLTLDSNGFVLDYKDLHPIKEYIDNSLDHRHLNEVFGCAVSAEQLAKILYDTFRDQFHQLYAVEVSETPKTLARYEQDTN